MKQTDRITEQAATLPGEEGVRFYRQHGYYITPKILADDVLDAALNAIESFYAGERDRAPPDGAAPGWERRDGSDILRKNDFASIQRDEFAALVRYPLIGATAAALVGEPVRLWVDQLLYKPPDSPEVQGNVGWHTDRQYWQCCTSADMLTAWIPLRDCSATDGTMTVIDGSHRWSDNTDDIGFDTLNFRTQSLDGLEQFFDANEHAIVPVPIEMKRGQVSFHHCKTIHGSGPNRSVLPRIALAVHLQGASNRWRKHVYRMPDGSIKQHDLEVICRRQNGVPDYADPAICPLLWPRNDRPTVET